VAKTADATTAFESALIQAEPVNVKTCCGCALLITTSDRLDRAGDGGFDQLRPVGPRARYCPVLPVVPLIESNVVEVNVTVPTKTWGC